MKTIPFLSLLLSSTLPLYAMPRAGSKATEWPADPQRHVVSIQREAADDLEKNLIASAEKSQPDPAALRNAIDKKDGDAQPQASQWWNKEVLGIRIPFAITADAVQYYSDLVKKHGQQKLSRYTQPTSSFTYQAKVSKPASYELNGKSLENVTVVTMTLKFRQHFVATVAEGFRFEKTRQVVFDQDGKIIHIQGDGDVAVPIMVM